MTVSYAFVFVGIARLPDWVLLFLNDLWPLLNTITVALAGLSLVYVAIRADLSTTRRSSSWWLWMLAGSQLWIAVWLGRGYVAPKFGAELLDPTAQSLVLRYAYWWLYLLAALFAATATVNNYRRAEEKPDSGRPGGRVLGSRTE